MLSRDMWERQQSGQEVEGRNESKALGQHLLSFPQVKQSRIG